MKYAACPDIYYDPNTGTCAQVVFVDMPSILPALTVAQGLQIGGVILTLWASAFALKFVRRFLFR